MPHQNTDQTRRRSAFPYASDAVSSRNLAKPVVAVTAVLGTETAELQATRNFLTRGPRASRRAKHGRSPREASAGSQRLLEGKGLVLLMELTRKSPEQSSQL